MVGDHGGWEGKEGGAKGVYSRYWEGEKLDNG